MNGKFHSSRRELGCQSAEWKIHIIFIFSTLMASLEENMIRDVIRLASLSPGRSYYADIDRRSCNLQDRRGVHLQNENIKCNK